MKKKLHLKIHNIFKKSTFSESNNTFLNYRFFMDMASYISFLTTLSLALYNYHDYTI